MKAASASMVAAGIALAAFSPARVQAEEPLNPMCEKLLPVSLIEKVTGAKGVKNLPPNPRKAAGGDCDYGQDYDHLMFMVGLYLSGGDSAWKGYEGVVKGRDNVKLSGVGDVAYASGGTIVVARKGKNVVALSSFNGPKGIPSVAQMSELIRHAFAEAEKMGFK